MRCDTWWLLPLHSVSAGTHTHKLAWLPHIGMRVKTQSATCLGCTTPEDWYSSSVFLLWIDRGLCYCLDKAIFLKTAMHAAPIKSFLKKSPTALRFWGRGVQPAASSAPMPLTRGFASLLFFPSTQYLKQRTAEPANPLIKEALTFNFTNVALFHKEQREFISNLTQETYSTCTCLSSGDHIITPQISDYRNFSP